IDDPQDQAFSCSIIPPPPLSTTKRTDFGTLGCMDYGYPSTGGFLIKEADLLVMFFLSLPRSYISQRSPSADEEDRFCNLLRRTGATFWPSKWDWFNVQVGLRGVTEEEEKVIVYGWLTDGIGGSMEERIQIMREYGATFIDVTQVEELNPI
ncbi:hypothetical protein N7508_006790, partial [Penicillium antarcticum]|uniref:uncharacterized protein n=1 Tax=Penicillium antarcticum TaxID=416450 RepID=UPI0023A24A0F